MYMIYEPRFILVSTSSCREYIRSTYYALCVLLIFVLCNGLQIEPTVRMNWVVLWFLYFTDKALTDIDYSNSLYHSASGINNQDWSPEHPKMMPTLSSVTILMFQASSNFWDKERYALTDWSLIVSPYPVSKVANVGGSRSILALEPSSYSSVCLSHPCHPRQGHGGSGEIVFLTGHGLKSKQGTSPCPFSRLCI